MMKYMYGLASLMALAFNLSAADASGRVNTRVLAGQVVNVADEFSSFMNPVTVLNSLAYTVTNNSDGLILVRTNATVLVHIGLPNPTNFPNRRFEIHTLGASTAVLTNVTFGGTFTEMFTMATAATYALASNKTAVAYSTGTNYIVRTY